MEESILQTIKKMLGIMPSDENWDEDILNHINSAFMTLYQLGFGSTPIFIEDEDTAWSDVLSIENYAAVKTYVYDKVKVGFDPPQSGSLMGALEKQIAEYEWRLHIMVDK